MQKGLSGQGNPHGPETRNHRHQEMHPLFLLSGVLSAGHHHHPSPGGCADAEQVIFLLLQ
jgi:hypothetical protein